MEALLIGKTIENYKITGILGKGGMSTVFKAIDQSLDREVALKIMESRLSRRKDFVKRFRTEGRSQARLRHPNIVNVYALRESREGLYIVMEYVPGGTLKKRIAQEGAFTPPDALAIVKQILLAIKHAHSRGIIHRDIKPANILLDKSDLVKVTDFGLAKMQHDFGFTHTGVAVGTLGYAPPEQLKSLKNTDHRSDLYSIGMSFYEMLVGKLPFGDTDSNLTIQLAIMEGNIPSPDLLNPDIPAEFVQVVRKATHINPNRRYQTALDMLEDIEHLELKYKKVKALPPPREMQVQNGPKIPDHIFDTVTQTNPANTVYQTPPQQKQTSGTDIVEDVKPEIPFSTLDFRKFNIIKPFYLKLLILAMFLGVLFGSTSAVYYYKNSMLPGDSPTGAEIPVSILSRPEGASVYINGLNIGITPLETYLSEAGEAAFRLVKDNYFVKDTSLYISPNDTNALVINLRESAEEEAADEIYHRMTGSNANDVQFGRLKLISSPAGAEVYLNGKKLPNVITPHIFEKIAPGNYHLELRKKGFANFQKSIEVLPSESRPLRATLKALSGQLKLTSNPAGARVWLNGRYQRGLKTPAKLADLPAGTYNVVLKKDGHRSYKKRIRVQSQKTAKLHGKLKSAFGEISIVALPFGTSYINGEIKRRNTNIPWTEKLSTGKHKVKVTHPTHGYWEKTVEIKEGKRAELIVDFNEKVSVKVEAYDETGLPLDSKIYVDGNYIYKTTPAVINVRKGMHRIETRRDGYILTKSPPLLNYETPVEQALKFKMYRQKSTAAQSAKISSN